MRGYEQRSAWLAALLFVLPSFLRPSASQAQSPIELQVTCEEANEALFDGEYGETIRLTDKGLDWTSSAANRKLLASVGRDWTVEECMLNVLQAEALHLSGSTSLARTMLTRALGQLEARRTYYQRLHGQTAWYWLYSAFIHFVDGDLKQPVADFGITESTLVPKKVVLAAKAFGQPSRSSAAYSRAGDCLERLLALDPTPTQKVVAGMPLVINRLMIKLLVSKARNSIDKVGRPKPEDVTDAESFLIRAEELLRNNIWWELFIAPGALFPLSYAQLIDAQEEKKRAQGALPTEQDIIELKQLWCHAINDYVTVMNHRAEVEAWREMRDGGFVADKPWARENAERCYQRALQLCQSHYRGRRHPLLVETEISKAKWFALVSDATRFDRELTDLERRRFVSYARDSIFLVHKIIAQTSDNVLGQNAFELRCVEYQSLINLLTLHQAKPFMAAEQLKQVEDRKDQIMKNLEELVDAKK